MAFPLASSLFEGWSMMPSLNPFCFFFEKIYLLLVMIALVIWVLIHVTGTDPIGWLWTCSTSSAKLMMTRHKIKPVFKSTQGSVFDN